MQSITTYHRHRHPAGPHIALADVVVVAAVENHGIDYSHLLCMMTHYLPLTFCCLLRSISNQSPGRNHIPQYPSCPVENHMIVVAVVVPGTVVVLAAIKKSQSRRFIIHN